MKQLLQSLRNGETELAEVPAPQAKPGQHLIRTSATLVSAGTEKMLAEFGKGNLIKKAFNRPDKAKQVIEKAQTDGLFATVDAVQSKLDQPIPLGYCNVGTIIESCNNDLHVGDRVVSNGCHAEIVAVGQNLCAKIPDNVTDEEASFTVLASIGLQGIRLAKPAIGEIIVVIGLGLIGLLTVQMLRAQGCRVIGVDIDDQRISLAKAFGAETVNGSNTSDVLAYVHNYTEGVGVDAVIITAASKSNKPISQAARMCRKRGRIILVGVVGLELNRAEFYEKELTFQVSCSYGPGRYDPSYEVDGKDYPIGFVRWTEQRNFEAVLQMMSSRVLDLEQLTTHRFSIENGSDAIQLLTSKTPSLGIIIHFPKTESKIVRRVTISSASDHTMSPGLGNIAFLGAGNYAGRVLIPAFKSAGAKLHTVVTNGGVSALHFGRKFRFRAACTDESDVYLRNEIDTVVVATRHNLHARQVIKALEHDKHVFCEKPLCITKDELAEIERIASEKVTAQVMVGFNRRFSPLIHKMKELLSTVHEAKSIIITVNAGEIESDHWIHDPKIGGGRVIGEACHFIDLARFLASSKIIAHYVECLNDQSSAVRSDDKLTLTLKFENGSFASIHYLSNGNKGFPKERIEVFTAGKILQLNNFRSLRGFGWHGFKSMRLIRQNKGQRECVQAFLKAVQKGGPSPIPREEIFEITSVALEITEKVYRGC